MISTTHEPGAVILRVDVNGRTLRVRLKPERALQLAEELSTDALAADEAVRGSGWAGRLFQALGFDDA